MNTKRRGRKIFALAAASAIVFAACGSDNNSSSSNSAATNTDAAGTTATSAAPTGTDATTGGSTPMAKPVFQITYDIAADANWNDGSPITVADFQCTYEATLNTPGSLSTTGYDQITSVEAGSSDKQVVVQMSTTYAPWKGLFFFLLQADQMADCNDVSADFDGGIKFSGNEWVQDSWTDEQIVYTPNPEYKGPRKAGVDRIVIVPAEDGTTLLKSGAVDFIFPQAYTGIDAELNDPNVKFDSALGGSYEALYFQQDKGPFADDDYRAAFAQSIDMQGLYDQIYAPFAQGTPLLTCGPIGPGPYCDDTLWKDTYNPEAAAKTLTDAGWTKSADGMWQNPAGEVPQVRWMVNTGNTRRESAQAYLIPLMKAQGFDVVADNCEALPCVFETRLPSLDYDLAMYISTVAPDPSYLTTTLVCDQIPSDANDNKGQNSTGWCNEEASKQLKLSDTTIDETQRTEEVRKAIAFMREDWVLMPTLQFPNIGAYRTDKLANSQGELANYQAINDWYQWKDVDGDGQIVIGAEQFPAADCANPVTECSNSSWYQWVAGFPVLPGAFRTTNDLAYVKSDILASDPKVEDL